MNIACLDLEGVLFPELWATIAEHTGIAALAATTRDYRDYDELMRMRLGALQQSSITLTEIQQLLKKVEPLPGAAQFVHALRPYFQVVILSDTFEEFAAALMGKIEWPLLLCHRLEVDARGCICNYQLRQPDPKRRAVEAFQSINCTVSATGDSYNDLGMFHAADFAFWFCPPEQIASEHPQFPAMHDYAALRDSFLKTLR